MIDQKPMELPDLDPAAGKVTKGDVLPDLSKLEVKLAPKSSGRFDYVRYDEIAQAKSAAIKAKCIELEVMIEEAFGAVPPSPKIARSKALALTALEEAYMWCGKAIRDEQVVTRKTELQEERNDA